MIPQNENPGALAGATGAKEVSLGVGKSYIWGGAIASLGLEATLTLKPQGWFRVETNDGMIMLVVHRPGCSPETTLCLSPGHANQLRLSLSDEGMAGLIEGAL